MDFIKLNVVLAIMFLKLYSKFRDILAETEATENQKTQGQGEYYA